MDNLTMTHLIDIVRRLHRSVPHLGEEIELLANAALTGRDIQWVEVTDSQGHARMMAAEDYTRLTAMDLAHSSLRVLSPNEAREKMRDP